ncbi:MAG TPA: acetylxylan esterase, partial [Terriglobia bacterium]|nr:acetylxylan esterase [Terriglobia bacterium]
MNSRKLSLILAAVCFILPALWLAGQSGSPRDQMITYLNGIAKTQLESRSSAIAGVRNRADADRRKAEVREKILRLIGGLPEGNGPVSVREFRKTSGDGFRVERIAYESQPGFWVTADVYIPVEGAGPFPAIVLAPGHGAGGKSENWNWGGNFARNGIIALAYDPIGQGERLQYYDAGQQKSKIGNPTGEHGEANIGPMLIGDNIARYMVNDAMRGVDYLISRKDVDPSRIGAFGCSGGGTSTAYFAALDERVKVAASACYITSFNELLASPTGAQDAEQSIPHFIEQGLDFADWVEAFAPKPYAVISTMDDMF